jgi:hypothetical protein
MFWYSKDLLYIYIYLSSYTALVDYAFSGGVGHHIQCITEVKLTLATFIVVVVWCYIYLFIYITQE